MTNRREKSNCYSFEIPRERSQHTMSSIEQRAEILLCLSPVEVANLKEGISFFRNKSTGKDYILYKNKCHLRACKNMCKHQGGLFIKDIEDLDGRFHVSVCVFG
uniref:Uncharacterized protein n=1 Tax=Propithecus coquereli TaxID=379532 RepID=A0A2K6GZJ2_PROCO